MMMKTPSAVVAEKNFSNNKYLREKVRNREEAGLILKNLVISTTLSKERNYSSSKLKRVSGLKKEA